MVEGLIYGEDIVMTNEVVYCLTAPYLENGTWKPSKLYEYKINTKKLENINLGNIVLARSLTYNKQKGLFINVIPTFYYKYSQASTNCENFMVKTHIPQIRFYC